MTIQREVTQTILCDGDDCSAEFDVEGDISARMARLQALDEGWEVNLVAALPHGHRDLCPKCVAVQEAKELAELQAEIRADNERRKLA